MIISFRGLDKAETEVASKVVTRGAKPLPLKLTGEDVALTVAYVTDHDDPDKVKFTQCVLRWETDGGCYLSHGAAKRMTYKGGDNPTNTGRDIAFYRALMAAIDDELLVLY